MKLHALSVPLEKLPVAGLTTPGHTSPVVVPQRKKWRRIGAEGQWDRPSRVNNKLGKLNGRKWFRMVCSLQVKKYNPEYHFQSGAEKHQQILRTF
jgi:hypothetical protein